MANLRTLELVKRFEGLHDGNKLTPLLEPQNDPIGIPTIGYGAIYDKNLRRVTMATPAITLEEAEELLARDFAKAEAAVRRYTAIELNDNQSGALGSFVYNLGAGAFKSSTLRKRVNDPGAWDDITYQFSRWVYAGGRRLSGLVLRREAEAELFFAED